MKYFPIIIFAYNRPNLIKNCLKSLKKYKNLNKHKVYFFCDGPKSINDKSLIERIRIIIENSEIKFTKKYFKNKNYGLAKSIISGVSKILKKNKAVIVLEDDLYLDKNAISFINFFLNKKNNDKKIGSISAYSYLHNKKFKFRFDCYYSKRHCSWAWGTWYDRWKNVTWSKTYIDKHFSNKKSINKFDQVGRDLNLLLWAQKNKLINSWAIRFNLYCSNNELYSLQPRYSLVRNSGHGLNSTHQKFKKNDVIKKFFKINSNFFNKRIQYSNNEIINSTIKNIHKKSTRLLFLYWSSKIKIINFK